MRIPRSWITPMARRIVDTLLAEEMIVADVDPATLAGEVEALILDELMVEDRINDEVRVILSKHETDIASGRLDYQKLFDLTKSKIVKDRGIIL